MILGNIGSSMGAQEKQLDIFNSWCVDGIITYGQGYQNLSQKYDSLNCPVVCIESPGGDQTDNVIIDDCALIKEAITDMIQCGHQKSVVFMAFLMHIHRFREQTDIRKVFWLIK